MRIWNFNNCVARDRVKGFKGYAIHYPYIYSCLRNISTIIQDMSLLAMNPINQQYCMVVQTVFIG